MTIHTHTSKQTEYGTMMTKGRLLPHFFSTWGWFGVVLANSNSYTYKKVDCLSEFGTTSRPVGTIWNFLVPG